MTVKVLSFPQEIRPFIFPHLFPEQAELSNLYLAFIMEKGILGDFLTYVRDRPEPEPKMVLQSLFSAGLSKEDIQKLFDTVLDTSTQKKIGETEA